MIQGRWLPCRWSTERYILTRPATDITMAEIVEALEGNLAPIECLTPEGMCHREVTGNPACPTKLLWTRVHGSINRALEQTTLAELVSFAEHGIKRPNKSTRGRAPALTI